MSISPDPPYGAVLLVGFGGPEGPDDVLPFLHNVTRGRDVPASRLDRVAENYMRLGGISPINEQLRRIRAALAAELGRRGVELDVYWGNRNWDPYLADTVAELAGAGVGRALALVMSAYSSHPSCRRYLEDIADARAVVGATAPIIDKIRAFHDHPGFVEPFVAEVVAARQRLPRAHREGSLLLCTAHSIPTAMADDCDYERQLRETAALIADGAGFDEWRLVWQSRSGPPTISWLEPDINDHLRTLGDSTKAVIVAPIGFVTDHMEVVWDLDVEAAATAAAAGILVERAETPGTGPDPRFVAMLADLIAERLDPSRARPALGPSGPRPDYCPGDCCPAAPRRA